MFQAYDAGADTVIVQDGHGNIAEGPGFNVFIVEQGSLATPAEGVLDGMTRRCVFEISAELGIACATEPIAPARLAAADEVFLTTTAGGVIPVTVVNGAPVGDGAPGTFVRAAQSGVLGQTPGPVARYANRLRLARLRLRPTSM